MIQFISNSLSNLKEPEDSCITNSLLTYSTAILKLKIKNMKHLSIQPTRIRTIFVIALLCLTMQSIAQPDSIRNLQQFLYPDFTRGVVKLKSGPNRAAMMNYNTVTGKMIFYQDGQLLDLIKPETVDTIYLQNAKFVFHENEFYELLVKAPISLFIEHKSNITSSGKPSAYGTSSETASSTSISKMYDDKTYNFKLPENFKVTPSPVYWVRMNNVMYKIASERQFLKLFPTKVAEIKKFINQSNINFKKQDDLIKLVTYCNTLKI